MACTQTETASTCANLCALCAHRSLARPAWKCLRHQKQESSACCMLRTSSTQGWCMCTQGSGACVHPPSAIGLLHSATTTTQQAADGRVLPKQSYRRSVNHESCTPQECACQHTPQPTRCESTCCQPPPRRCASHRPNYLRPNSPHQQTAANARRCTACTNHQPKYY